MAYHANVLVVAADPTESEGIVSRLEAFGAQVLNGSRTA